MDSAGILTSKDIPKSLQVFLCAQFKHKKFYATPVLQSSSSNLCGYFSIIYLILRLKHNFSLRKFSSLFTDNLNHNQKVISDFFHLI